MAAPTLLPPTVAVFAVPGAILLPGGTLPLVVFEPRYLALVEDCLGTGRMLALVQPRAGEGGAVPGLQDVGCLGRISAFAETGDGRYLITIAGLSRFRLTGEVEGRAGYRRVEADYRPFATDLGGETGPIDRAPLLAVLGRYLGRLGLGGELAELEKAGDAELTTRLALACPFDPDQKQALLEAADGATRGRLITTFMQQALLTDTVSAAIH